MTDQPKKPLKHLEICPKCGGYMVPQSPMATNAGPRDWKDETFHRSFGGVAIRKLVCEKCAFVDTFQVDDLGFFGEDD